jgi:hypothetical protein
MAGSPAVDGKFSFSPAQKWYGAPAIFYARHSCKADASAQNVNVPPIVNFCAPEAPILRTEPMMAPKL